ncbi:YkyA family protein [Peribacillus loiseleuriae]|nr:YkyA family protein [Peribacillus loiseleuriae]
MPIHKDLRQVIYSRDTGHIYKFLSDAKGQDIRIDVSCQKQTNSSIVVYIEIRGSLTMSKFFKWTVLCLVLGGILSGCTAKDSPEEQIYQILEAAVKKEKTFEEQQQPIAELENKEKEYYTTILKLGLREFDQIVKLSNEAINNIEKRKELIEKERESMLASHEKFKQIDDKIKNIEDQHLKKEAEKLKVTMIERYEAHEKLYTFYKKSLDLDKALYTLFQKENLKMDELEAQIEKINQSYQTVIEANDAFNNKTNQYNEEKQKFYKDAEIEIATTDEAK